MSQLSSSQSNPGGYTSHPTVLPGDEELNDKIQKLIAPILYQTMPEPSTTSIALPSLGPALHRAAFKNLYDFNSALKSKGQIQQAWLFARSEDRSQFLPRGIGRQIRFSMTSQSPASGYPTTSNTLEIPISHTSFWEYDGEYCTESTLVAKGDPWSRTGGQGPRRARSQLWQVHNAEVEAGSTLCRQTFYTDTHA